MMTTSALPVQFLALAMLCNASIAWATPPSAGLAPLPILAKSQAGAKPSSSADPFESTSAGANAAGPQKQAVPPSPTPSEQNLPSKALATFMAAFEGRWKCDTKFAPGAMGPSSQMVRSRTEMTIRKEFGGHSWHGEFKLAKTSLTTATTGVFQIGYAASTNQATFLSYDSVGSAMMGAGTLSGNAVTFVEEGFLKGVKVRVRETLIAKAPNRIYHRFELEDGRGYRLMAEDTCVK
jgi:hypothetical protein